MSRYVFIIKFLCLLLLLLTSVAVAQDVRDATNHYTVTLPDGWGEVPLAMVETLNNEIKQRQIKNVRYHRAFQPKSHFLMEYPYILMQAIPFDGETPSFEQLERSMNGAMSPRQMKQRTSLRTFWGKLPLGNRS